MISINFFKSFSYKYPQYIILNSYNSYELYRILKAAIEKRNRVKK